MDNYEGYENDVKVGQLIGNFLTSFLSAIIILGVTAVGVWGAWNLVFAELIDVNKMKYYQAIMLIVGWRCLTYNYPK